MDSEPIRTRSDEPKGITMSMTYLDTFAAVIGSGTDGVAYATMTRAMKVHVRSLHTEGHVAAFIEDDQVSLADDGAVICLTAEGQAYADLLAEGGLLQPREVLQEQPVSKPKRKKTVSKRKNTKRVPTPSESVESPVLPEGTTARRVQGNQHGDQLIVDPVIDRDAEIEDLKRKVSALMSVITA
jgi:hypothetical protein